MSSPASSSSADPAHQPPRVSRPHRCNDRIEDVVQVRENRRKNVFSLLAFFQLLFFVFSIPRPQPPLKKKTISSSSLQKAFVSLRLDLLRPALSTLVDCLRSEPGSEPRGSYQVLKEGSKFLKERVIDSDGKTVVDEK